EWPWISWPPISDDRQPPSQKTFGAISRGSVDTVRDGIRLRSQRLEHEREVALDDGPPLEHAAPGRCDDLGLPLLECMLDVLADRLRLCARQPFVLGEEAGGDRLGGRAVAGE